LQDVLKLAEGCREVVCPVPEGAVQMMKDILSGTGVTVKALLDRFDPEGERPPFEPW
jgi:hypothetical protein